MTSIINNSVSERYFGIVQGRLTVSPPGELQWFPQDSWSDEFLRAKNVGIEFIELLTERDFNPNNPVWSVNGRDCLREIAETTGRRLYSICTDYIIDHALLGDESDAVKQHVREFIDAGGDLKCAVAVFPLLEESNLTAQNWNYYVPILREFAKQAARYKMTICIESLLNGFELRKLLESIDESNVKCVFDTGNRVLDNQDLGSEIRLLGGDWIQHVHIKDKNHLGENVLMGRGLVDFLNVFEALSDIDYRGPLVFETTRGTDPVVTADYHMDTCRFFMHEASNASSS